MFSWKKKNSFLFRLNGHFDYSTGVYLFKAIIENMHPVADIVAFPVRELVWPSRRKKKKEEKKKKSKKKEEKYILYENPRTFKVVTILK